MPISITTASETTIKLTAALDWRGPTEGPEAKLQPLRDRTALADLVNRQPFRTAAESQGCPSTGPLRSPGRGPFCSSFWPTGRTTTRSSRTWSPAACPPGSTATGLISSISCCRNGWSRSAFTSSSASSARSGCAGPTSNPARVQPNENTPEDSILFRPRPHAGLRHRRFLRGHDNACLLHHGRGRNRALVCERSILDAAPAAQALRRRGGKPAGNEASHSGVNPRRMMFSAIARGKRKF